MSALLEGLLAGLEAMTVLEAVAVALALGYLVLAVRENIWCWACAFGSTAIYIGLFYEVALLQESLLNVFYLVMAVYGWWQWRHGGGDRGELPVQRWSAGRHLTVIGGTSVVVVVAGTLFDRYTNADYPYLDAFTTWFAVVTTWMVARKVLENWLYWFVIDSTAIYLYLQKGFVLTAVLFFVYLIIIVFGYRSWALSWKAQQSAHEHPGLGERRPRAEG
ncbi:MAG: nicotinamide riboside transporter PnuC [Pseudomonadota bacterium]